MREIGIRLLAPRGNYMTNNQAAPGGRSTITWISCEMGSQANPEKPRGPIEPEFIFSSAITVVRNPNYVEFSNPCRKFE